MDTDLFGAPVGKLTDPSGAELSNDYANISDRSINDMANTDRVQPRQVASGVTRGTQRIINTDGSYITLGAVPGNESELAIAFWTADNEMISKSTGATDYKYDKDTGKNYYQNGELPDGSTGAIFVKDGYNVTDAFN